MLLESNEKAFLSCLFIYYLIVFVMYIFQQVLTGKFELKFIKMPLVLFILLNSKIIWRQIMKLPFMGSTEPSMIALIVNSLLAAIVYFIITKYILN